MQFTDMPAETFEVEEVLDHPWDYIGVNVPRNPDTGSLNLVIGPAVDIDAVAVELHARSLRAYAIARWMAVDLANGRGDIDDEYSCPASNTGPP